MQGGGGGGVKTWLYATIISASLVHNNDECLLGELEGASTPSKGGCGAALALELVNECWRCGAQEDNKLPWPCNDETMHHHVLQTNLAAAYFGIIVNCHYLADT